jgi:Sel1 repeat
MARRVHHGEGPLLMPARRQPNLSLPFLEIWPDHCFTPHGMRCCDNQIRPGLGSIASPAAWLAIWIAFRLPGVLLASGPFVMGFGDIAAIKAGAEAGNPQAQAKLANALVSSFHASEALQWYRKAAAQGNLEAEYQMGQMLLVGGTGIPDNLSVPANPAEVLRWTFIAATNSYPLACFSMGRALMNGMGTATNLVAAYAWLRLASELPPTSIVGRVAMNELALKLDTASLAQAEALEVQFKAGHWQTPVIRSIPESDPRLKLNGITLADKTRLAVINGRTLSPGESTSITIKPNNLTVKSAVLTIKCLRIEGDSVLVSIQGEDIPRLLRLK